MQCEQCNGPVTGKSRTCSARCRKALSRAKCDASVTNSGDKPSVTEVDVSQFIGPDVYYQPRTNPDLLNWGEPMTRAELEANKFKANRVPIPGDWDYAGAVDDTVTPAVLGVV